MILPRHPHVHRAYGELFARQLNEYLARLEQEQGLRSINCVDFLDESQFFDVTHPSPEGAERFTDFLAARLREHATICFSTHPNSSSSR